MPSKINSISIANLLGEDAQLISYRPSLLPIGKTVTGTILLSQMIYWWFKTTKKGLTEFYKFQTPCDNKKYKIGDSWTEELGFSKKVFVNALKQIGYKTTKKKLTHLKSLQAKIKLSNKEQLELLRYKTAIVYYRTDINNITWYQLNMGHFTKLLKVTYGDTGSDERALPEVTKGDLVNNTEITTEITSRDLIKIKSGVTALPSAGVGGIIRDSKKPCNIKKTRRKSKKQTTSKLPSSKYTITSKSFSQYLQLKKAGATTHKDATQAYFDTMDKLHALFSPKCKEPYSMCYVPEQFINYKWTLEEFIEVFEFHLKHAESINKKKIKSIGQFIVSKGFNGHKSWSPLLYWHQQMNKTNTNDLDKHGTKLYKSFKRSKINAKDLENTSLNKTGQQIEILEKYYEFSDDSNTMSYPFGIVDYFTNVYVKEKLNDTRFKIYHINKKTFVRDFIRTALQRNFMKKQPQCMSLDLTNVELGQKPILTGI